MAETKTATKRKTSTKTKKSVSNKKNEFEKKIDDILSDIDDLKLTKKQKDGVITKLKSSNKISLEEKESNSWLEEELERVTDENEKLKKQLANVQQLPVGQKNNIQGEKVLEQKVRGFFYEIEGILTGNNPKRARFATVQTKHVLDRLIYHFDFLKRKK